MDLTSSLHAKNSIFRQHNAYHIRLQPKAVPCPLKQRYLLLVAEPQEQVLPGILHCAASPACLWKKEISMQGLPEATTVCCTAGHGMWLQTAKRPWNAGKREISLNGWPPNALKLPADSLWPLPGMMKTMWPTSRTCAENPPFRTGKSALIQPGTWNPSYPKTSLPPMRWKTGPSIPSCSLWTIWPMLRVWGAR